MKTIINNSLSLFILNVVLIGSTSFIPPASFSSPFGNKYWIVESSVISPALDINMDGKPDTDLMIVVPSCEKDDADQYRNDGTIVTNRGKKLCDEDEEQEEETGSWSYNEKTATLTMNKYDSRREIVSTIVEKSIGRIVLVTNHKSAKSSHTIKTVLKAK